MTDGSQPDFWYSILMLNDWEDRIDPAEKPNLSTGLSPSQLTLYAPTPDGSLALQQGKFLSNFYPTVTNVQTDLNNLQAYVKGLKVQLEGEPNYGQLIYDEVLGGKTEPEFATSNWGFFVSGAEQHNADLSNNGQFSLFSVIAPLPVLYDPREKQEYRYYIPEFTMKGENLKDFLQLKNSDLNSYAGKFPQAEPEAPAQFPDNDIGLRPANWEPSGDEGLGDVPDGEGYYANKFFVPPGPLERKSLPGPDFTQTGLGFSCGGMFENWRLKLNAEIKLFRQIFINSSGATGQQLSEQTSLSLQYQYFIDQREGFVKAKGYYSTPSMTSITKGSLTINYDPKGTNIFINNKNPYLNLLYLKLSWADGAPKWWDSPAAEPGIPIYQGSPDKSPKAFERTNKVPQTGLTPAPPPP